MYVGSPLTSDFSDSNLEGNDSEITMSATSDNGSSQPPRRVTRSTYRGWQGVRGKEGTDWQRAGVRGKEGGGDWQGVRRKRGRPRASQGLGKEAKDVRDGAIQKRLRATQAKRIVTKVPTCVQCHNNYSLSKLQGSLQPCKHSL